MAETSTEVFISDSERDVLERIRVRYALATVEQAAEWLAKRRLRRSTQQITGRGRALYAVGSKQR
jgi:hypothetical protein